MRYNIELIRYDDKKIMLDNDGKGFTVSELKKAEKNINDPSIVRYRVIKRKKG